MNHLYRACTLFAILAILAVHAQAPVENNPFIAKEKAEYDKVAKHLDSYGNFILYANTAEAVQGLDRAVDNLEKVILAAVAQQQGPAQMYAPVGIKVFKKAYADCGLRDIGGFGISSLKTGKNLYRNKLFVQHSPQKGDGKFWHALGKESHDLTCIDLLPADTALACFSDFDVNVLWNWQMELVQATGNPQIIAIHAMQVTQMNQKLGLDKLIQSTDGEIGMLLTLDRDSVVPLPQGDGKTLEVPEPGLALFIKVKDSQLKDFIFSRMVVNKNGQEVAMPHQDKIESGISVRSYLLPLPSPIVISPSFAVVDNYLVIASNPKLMKSIISTKKGAPGLKGEKEFRTMMKGLPVKGNGFHYVSPRLQMEISKIQRTMVETNPEANKMFGDVLRENQEIDAKNPFFCAGITQILPNGLYYQGNSSMSGGKAVLVQGAIAPVAIGAAVLLPTLAKARNKARNVNSMGNLKQIGLALLMYSGENAGAYPPVDGEDGLNILVQEQILEMGKVYVHPSDKKRAFRKGQAKLSNNNCSYVYIGGGFRDDDAQATTLPIAFEKPDVASGNKLGVLFGDGHVEQITGKFKTCSDVIDRLQQRNKYAAARLKLLKDKAKNLDIRLGYKAAK